MFTYVTKEQSMSLSNSFTKKLTNLDTMEIYRFLGKKSMQVFFKIDHSEPLFIFFSSINSKLLFHKRCLWLNMNQGSVDVAQFTIIRQEATTILTRSLWHWRA